MILRLLIIVAAILLMAMLAEKPPALVRLDVYPRFGSAGGDLRLLIVVEQDAHNRTLAWAVESDEYSRAAEEQLDGLDAPRSRFVNLKQLPAGRYWIAAWTVDGAGKVLGRAYAEACFSGMTVSCAE